MSTFTNTLLVNESSNFSTIVAKLAFIVRLCLFLCAISFYLELVGVIYDSMSGKRTSAWVIKKKVSAL